MSNTQAREEDVNLTPGNVVIVTVTPSYAASEHIPVVTMGDIDMGHVRGTIRRLRGFSLDLIHADIVNIDTRAVTPVGGVNRSVSIPWQAIMHISNFIRSTGEPDGASSTAGDAGDAGADRGASSR